MSMTTLKTLQFIGMFVAYSGLTVWLPSVMFRNLLQNRRLSEKFMMSYTFGNFYIINLVFLVQLLHISNRFTLILVTGLPAVTVWAKLQKIPVREIVLSFGRNSKKIIQGKLGIHTVISRVIFQIGKKLKGWAAIFWKNVVNQPMQWVSFMGVMAAIFWVYGRQIASTYGYCASDIPVHMSWINQMSRGNLFSSGVYPFGFHCVVYYLHEVFGFDVYVLMCEFFLVQVIYAHLVMLAFFKMFCKSSFFPYIGVLVYILAGFWADGTYNRYYSSLPQEFGMIFVIPSNYFLIRFFQIKKDDLKKKETYYQLVCFAMAFGLTLIIHFYGTMIAGICCVGIAMGYFFRFFRKEYFCRIMVTGIISIVLAVLPMVIAFATGTPLQGSLMWGMSIINSNDSSDETGEVEDTDNASESVPSQTQDNVQDEDFSTVRTSGDAQGTERENSQVSIQGRTEVRVAKQSVSNLDSSSLVQTQQKVQGARFSLSEKAQRVLTKGKGLMRTMAYYLAQYVIADGTEMIDIKIGYLMIGGITLLLFLGVLFYIFRRLNYGGLLVSASLCMAMLTILLSSESLAIPTLMDASRCSVYYAYLVMMIPVFLNDGWIYLVLAARKFTVMRNLASLIISIEILVTLIQCGWVKGGQINSGFVTNGAILCLDNIIYEDEDWTWTIVSANDETQMALDHGWHYELINFLRGMEYLREDTEITIPAQKVYIFIEKIPVSYLESYKELGQSISKKGAMQSLPGGTGIEMYKGEGRWIVMSRMYYWAQAFAEKYPNEMEVYYETDNFVCYKIEQNVYHLYNFAIDYGYNTVMTEEAEEE